MKNWNVEWMLAIVTMNNCCIILLKNFKVRDGYSRARVVHFWQTFESLIIFFIVYLLANTVSCEL
jgi:hypothetical protein